MPFRERRAARGVLLTPDDEILLLKFNFNNSTTWITPGGGIDEGEDTVAALARELMEETGREGFDIGPVIWKRSHQFVFKEDDVLQHETFHLVRCEKFDPPSEILDEVEREYVDDLRWWSIADITRSTDAFAPSRLSRLLPELASGDIPACPIDVGL